MQGRRSTICPIYWLSTFYGVTANIEGPSHKVALSKTFQSPRRVMMEIFSCIDAVSLMFENFSREAH